MSSGVSCHAEDRPILQSEPSPDLGRLLYRAPAAAAPRLLARALPCPANPSPGSALRGLGRVAGTPQTPDPDPVHQGGTLLAHHTALGLPAPSQPFSSVCRSP